MQPAVVIRLCTAASRAFRSVLPKAIVANWAYTKYSRMYPHIREAQLAWDDKFNTQIAGVDDEAARMSEEDARVFLTNYSCAQAENLVADWQKLGIYLMTKFLDGQERK